MSEKYDKLMEAIHAYHGQQISDEIDNEILDDIFEMTGSKRIYTSNYARSGNHPNAASISASSPESFNGKHISSLAPTWDIIRAYKSGKMDEDEYSFRYIDLMKERHGNARAVYNSIPHRTIMLCYEKPGEFCHRRVLAKWIERELTYEVPEWTSEEEMQKEAVVDSLLKF